MIRETIASKVDQKPQKMANASLGTKTRKESSEMKDCSFGLTCVGNADVVSFAVAYFTSLPLHH